MTDSPRHCSAHEATHLLDILSSEECPPEGSHCRKPLLLLCALCSAQGPRRSLLWDERDAPSVFPDVYLVLNTVGRSRTCLYQGCQNCLLLLHKLKLGWAGFGLIPVVPAISRSIGLGREKTYVAKHIYLCSLLSNH